MATDRADGRAVALFLLGLALAIVGVVAFLVPAGSSEHEAATSARVEAELEAECTQRVVPTDPCYRRVVERYQRTDLLTRLPWLGLVVLGLALIVAVLRSGRDETVPEDVAR
jgi:hypothetical protein